MKYVIVLFLLLLLPWSPLAASDQGESTAHPDGVVGRALSWIGVRYSFGSADEKKGFDCAGLVRRAFASIGVTLPRTAEAQFDQGQQVGRDDLSPGDLVFFRNTYKRGISHVGIYLGGNRFVHAASRRRSVVVDELTTPYYLSRFAGGRRISGGSEGFPSLVATSSVSLHTPPPVGPTP